MSAFMVGKEHVDAIVAVAMWGPRNFRASNWHRVYFGNGNGRRVEEFNLDEIGDMLIRENLSSIHGRYPDTETNPAETPGPIAQYWHEPYKFPFTSKPSNMPDVAAAFKLLACYEYQSCEHREWATSDAYDLILQMRKSLGSCIPGYEDAPWEWQETLR